MQQGRKHGKSHTQQIIYELHRKAGGFVFRRTPSGKRILSKAQKENRQRFKQAVA